MTLGVAALFPWRELLDSLPPAVGAIIRSRESQPRPRAIILAADSRWSSKIGEDFDDGGVKLVAVDSHAAAIYAGNTAAGEKALGQLSTSFTRARRTGGFIYPQQVLQSVWQEHQHEGWGLHVCLGSIDEAGNPILYRFNHYDSFRPKVVEGVETIGWITAREHFVDRLAQEISLQMSTPMTEKPLAMTAEHWHGVIARLVFETCENSADFNEAVGGPILSAIITGEGARGRSLFSVDPRSHPPRVKRLSLTPSQVAAFYERQGKRPPRRLPLATKRNSQT